jgi:hypothetical protein
MSTEYPTAFVKKYEATIHQLQQQMEARLRPTVSMDPNVTGEVAFYDQLDSIEATKDESRHGDTVYSTTPHRRRMVRGFTYRVADLIDRPDVVQALTNPANAYSKAFASAMNRAEDREIIAAYFATATTGKEGTGTAAFDTTNFQISSGTYTVARLLTAKKILDESENMKAMRFAVTSAEQMEDLLGETEVTSIDYNTVKALVQGDVDTFVGFKFVHSEQLGIDGSSNRRNPLYQKESMKLASWIDKVGTVDRLPSKNNSTQVFYQMRVGSTRMDEKGVVEMLSSE